MKPIFFCEYHKAVSVYGAARFLFVAFCHLCSIVTSGTCMISVCVQLNSCFVIAFVRFCSVLLLACFMGKSSNSAKGIYCSTLNNVQLFYSISYFLSFKVHFKHKFQKLIFSNPPYPSPPLFTLK